MAGRSCGQATVPQSVTLSPRKENRELSAIYFDQYCNLNMIKYNYINHNKTIYFIFIGGF